jgi:hypothetical protein
MRSAGEGQAAADCSFPFSPTAPTVERAIPCVHGPHRYKKLTPEERPDADKEIMALARDLGI